MFAAMNPIPEHIQKILVEESKRDSADPEQRAKWDSGLYDEY